MRWELHRISALSRRQRDQSPFSLHHVDTENQEVGPHQTRLSVLDIQPQNHEECLVSKPPSLGLSSKPDDKHTSHLGHHAPLPVLS